LAAAHELAVGADGYTYTKVADFAQVSNLCAYAMNDNGDVAYVTQQPYTANGLPGTLYQVHLWDPSGTDRVVHSATLQQGSFDPPIFTPPAVPFCGGFGGGTLGLAINNKRMISIEAFIPPMGGVGNRYGSLFVDAGVTPSSVTLTETPTSFN